jgi:hypothetical protein
MRFPIGSHARSELPPVNRCANIIAHNPPQFLFSRAIFLPWCLHQINLARELWRRADDLCFHRVPLRRHPIRAGNEPSRARLGSARPFHELVKEAWLGSTLAREPARLTSNILVLFVALFDELTLYKFAI